MSAGIARNMPTGGSWRALAEEAIHVKMMERTAGEHVSEISDRKLSNR